MDNLRFALDYSSSSSESDADAEQSIAASSNHDTACSTGSQSEASVDHTGSSALRRQANETQKIERMSRTETRHIRVWRLVLVVLLVIPGGVLSSFTYIFLQRQEDYEFEAAFRKFSTTIKEITGSRVQTMFDTLHFLGNEMTAYADEHNQTFPKVSMPKFEVKGSYARMQAGLNLILYMPLVANDTRHEWEQFAIDNQIWVNESKAIYRTSKAAGENSNHEHQAVEHADDNERDDDREPGDLLISETIFDYVDRFKPQLGQIESPENPLYAPVWHMTPPPRAPRIQMFNFLSGNPKEELEQILEHIGSVGDIVFTPFEGVSDLSRTVFNTVVDRDRNASNITEYLIRPHSLLYSPVFQELNDHESDLVGFFASALAFEDYLARLIPQGVEGIYCVVRNTCGQVHTYLLSCQEAIYIGEGDLHDKMFDLEEKIDFNAYKDPEASLNATVGCHYSFHVHPSIEFEAQYHTFTPVLLTMVVSVVMFLMTTAFLLYDFCVTQRNAKVVNVAAKSNAVVNSMFPSTVRERVLQGENRYQTESALTRLQRWLRTECPEDIWDRNVDDDIVVRENPIAEHFPQATVMFADIAMFSEWSAARPPSQIFILLETLYGAFDELSLKMGAFKVETIGDCYVAVAGLPEANKMHAITMCRFATECVTTLRVVVKKLEVLLGTDTGELNMRFGLHSGPVTAGVLRGERSRFQLFGETVNMAARMEANSLPNRILVSQETADLVIQAGKLDWISAREEPVHVHSFGRLQTYWLTRTSNEQLSTYTGATDEAVREPASWETPVDSNTQIYPQYEKNAEPDKLGRLVDWVTETLAVHVRQIVSETRMRSGANRDCVSLSESGLLPSELTSSNYEARQVIEFPPTKAIIRDKELPELDEELYSQLHSLVQNVAAMYPSHQFHSFEHASHSVLSMKSLLTPTNIDPGDSSADGSYVAELEEHGFMFGILPFSCLIAALLHDMFHSGVPIVATIKEESRVFYAYHGRCNVEQQRCCHFARTMLQGSNYRRLRRALFENDDDENLFQQIVVNGILATNGADADLIEIREEQWELAFESEESDSLIDGADRSLRSTLFADLLVRASVTAPMMQHWNVYRKWNERHFVEAYFSYLDGRIDRNPAKDWFKMEIEFFDNRIIPLAQKLGRFEGDEFLKFALANRQEFCERGPCIISEMVASI